MKRITAIIISALLLLGCQNKEETKRPIDIQGTWYGHLDAHYVSKPEKYIALTLNRGKATFDRLFHSYTSGWYDSEGTYAQGSDGIVRFNIEMTPSDLFKDDRNIPKITITHAEIGHSDLDGDVLKLHYTKEYREDYFDDELKGQTTNHYIWLDKNRPRY